MNTTWQSASECTFVLFLGGVIDLEKQKQCWALADRLRQTPIEGVQVEEVVVGMNALTVYLNLYQLPQAYEVGRYQAALSAFTEAFFLTNQAQSATAGKHVKIPVIYGGEHGMDLQASAKLLGMSVRELVERHTAPIYTVYFIGFLAGFPYLGGLPKELHLPRHTKPRLAVPAGSVGIGGAQTGIYPLASPGGWQLLGRTDLALFDKNSTPPTLLQAGDTLQFVAVDILD
ncbi:MAG: 5-oxoprolinase subunit PxpB [Moraxella sp.]|nr:5-oxoprolinase subunit PxpB [Moraxella sp.]